MGLVRLSGGSGISRAYPDRAFEAQRPQGLRAIWDFGRGGFLLAVSGALDALLGSALIHEGLKDLLILSGTAPALFGSTELLGSLEGPPPSSQLGQRGSVDERFSSFWVAMRFRDRLTWTSPQLREIVT